MRFSVLVWVCLPTVAGLVAPSCVAKPPGTESPAPKATPATSDDVARLAKRISDIEAKSRAHENTATLRFEALAAKLDAITERLDGLEERVRKQQRKPVAVAPKPRRPPRRGPDPAKTYSVPIKDSPFDGPKHALATVVVALEYAEPFSRKLLPVLDQVRSHYGKKVKIVYQNYIVHASLARPPALAVCAAGELGRHRDMVDAIWLEYDRYRNGDKSALSEPAMFALASSLGLSGRRFKRAYDRTCPTIIDREQAWFKGLGMSGVPGTFVNGRYLRGAQPFAKFEALIDEELARARKRVRAGTKLRKLYPQIVKTGDTGTN